MKTIKIIDLLNMISKGEEVPKLIKYNYVYFKWCERLEDKHNYKALDIEKNKYGYDYLDEIYIITSILNDEVEILEEKKIPEKLDYIHPDISCSYNESELLLRIEANKDKINSIIDYLESKEKGENEDE